MTAKEFASMIESTDIPNAYYQFTNDTAVPPPFICFYFESSGGFYADDINYFPIVHAVVELYTKEKDFDTEATLEGTFEAYDMAWSKAEQYLDDQQMLVEVYDMDVFITTEEESNA